MPQPKTFKKKSIWISPSGLNLFRDCPRCFWREKIMGIKRPRGIYPSLPSGMDRVIKVYFDQYRAKNELPPEFQSDSFKVNKLFADVKQLDLWRDWKTGLRYVDMDGSTMGGAVDDIMMDGDKYVPFDYKTKGSPTSKEDAQKYYQTQLDSYGLLMEKNNMPQAGYGFLLYFSPNEVREKGWVSFKLQAIRLEIQPERALKAFRDAVQVLQLGEAPQASDNCEYCTWLAQFQVEEVMPIIRDF